MYIKFIWILLHLDLLIHYYPVLKINNIDN